MMDVDVDTDRGEKRELPRPTVAVSANQCLQSFQDCFLRASSIHPREFSKIEDQYANFSTWASGVGVFARERLSLDHRLRHALEVRDVVCGLLEALNYRIQNCSDVLVVSSNSQSTDAPTLNDDERLGKSIQEIAAEIRHLHKISNTVRKASKEAQIVKAADFRIKDDEGNDVEQHLLGHFEHYIGDRFPDMNKTIQQRLARAMLNRRKRILYRRDRYKTISARTETAVPKAHTVLPAIPMSAAPPVAISSKEKQEQNPVVPTVMTATPSQVQSATTLDLNAFKKVSLAPSVASSSRTIKFDSHEHLVFPPAPGAAARRRYRQLMTQRSTESLHHDATTEEANLDPPMSGPSTKVQLDMVLKADLQSFGDIVCPYCLCALPAHEILDEKKWQNHVRNDLDAYVCLFENCDQPDEVYNHSNEWLIHSRQHGKLWRCPHHRHLGPFPTRDDYIKHMKYSHKTRFTSAQLRALANRNSYSASRPFTSCPLCGANETEVANRLEDHIAGHLRSLALKSLPMYHEELSDDGESEKNSVSVSKPPSRSTMRNFGEDEDMLEVRQEHFWDNWEESLPPQLPEAPTGSSSDQAQQSIVVFQGSEKPYRVALPKLSDTICFLMGTSAAAREQIMRLAENGSKHIITKDEANSTISLQAQEDQECQGDEQPIYWSLETNDSHVIVLRMSARVKDDQRGFQFGRNPTQCDIVFDNDPERRLSNIHFRIYANNDGTVMFEDQSTNGSFVDGKFFRARNASRGPAEGHLTTRELLHGSRIKILMYAEHGDLEFVVWKPLAKARSAHVLKQMTRYLQTLGDAYDSTQEPTNYHPSQNIDADVLEPQPIRGRNNSPDLGGKYTKVKLVKEEEPHIRIYEVVSKFDGRRYMAREQEVASLAKQLQKINTEIEIMGILNDPNIVQYIEHFGTSSSLIVINEWTPHGDLGQLISDRGPLPEPMCRRIAAQLLSALVYLEGRNLYHRYIQPDQILIQSLEPLVVKLSYLGFIAGLHPDEELSRVEEAGIPFRAPHIQPLTRTFVSIIWRPLDREEPEEVSKTRYIWCLGAVLFFALCGSPPLTGVDNSSNLREFPIAALQPPVDTTPLLGHKVSRTGIAFIRAMLDKNPRSQASFEFFQRHAWLRGVPWDSQQPEKRKEDEDEGGGDTNMLH